MDPPNNKSEDVTEDSAGISLEEDGNVEQENIEYSGLAAFVQSAYSKAQTQRLTDETRWLDGYRNYRGIYGPDVQFTDTEKSQAFIKVTKTKVLAAYSQVIDVLFAGAKFPIGVESRKFPTNVADAINYDPNAITSEKVEEKTGIKYDTPRTITRPDLAKDLGIYKDSLQPIEDSLETGPGKTPSSITFEPAKRAAQVLEKKMHDQLEESSASKHLRAVAFEMALFGTGILKGPFSFEKEYPKWNSDGEYIPEYNTIPKVEHVSIWDFYPDPDARSMDEAEYTIQRHRLNRSQIRALKNRPHFRPESIELAIDYGPSYEREYWEHDLEDNSNKDNIERFEVLEYWGVIDRHLAEDAALELPDKLADLDQVSVNIWICNNQILRLVINPFTPSRIPYAAVPYEMNPYSFFGVGVAENMTDTQLVMNGTFRMAIDNAALSGNLLIEVDETNLVPGQDMSVYPGKLFRRQAGAPGQSIFGTKFPNVSNELMMMFDKSRQLADESTGIPSYSHGGTGITGVGRTASGMSMLMGASQQAIKSVVRNIDDYLLAPLGRALFSFNMQFNFDENFVGDLEVLARGTESLMRNEIRSQRLLQFMQMTANQQMAPFVKYDFILRELAASMDLDEDRILNDPREAVIQAKMMAEIQSMMPQETPAAPAEGAPSIEDPTQTGGGNIAPGAAPEPGNAGFTGSGGGNNGGQQPPQEAPPQEPMQ
jgi:hypothetical protein